MEAKKRLQKDLKLIEKDIKRLKKRKKDIEQQLTDMASTFKEKFQIWYKNGKRGHHPWRPYDETEFPLISEFIHGRCETRNKVYDLTHLLGEEVLGLFDSDDYREFYDSEEEYQADILKYQPLMEEIMRNNIKTFTNDW